MQLKQYEEALDDCMSALAIDPTYEKATLKVHRETTAKKWVLSNQCPLLPQRGELLIQLERFEEAVQVLEAALEANQGSDALRNAVRNAKLELKKSKRKDYYKILGVAKVCEKDEPGAFSV